nr:hypothetical protein CFP56_31488 [Quercus suber]
MRRSGTTRAKALLFTVLYSTNKSYAYEVSSQQAEQALQQFELGVVHNRPAEKDDASSPLTTAHLHTTVRFEVIISTYTNTNHVAPLLSILSRYVYYDRRRNRLSRVAK